MYINKNCYKFSDKRIDSALITAPSVPPKFIMQVPTASVTAGEKILLEAQYEGMVRNSYL